MLQELPDAGFASLSPHSAPRCRSFEVRSVEDPRRDPPFEGFLLVGSRVASRRPRCPPAVHWTTQPRPRAVLAGPPLGLAHRSARLRSGRRSRVSGHRGEAFPPRPLSHPPCSRPACACRCAPLFPHEAVSSRVPPRVVRTPWAAALTMDRGLPPSMTRSAPLPGSALRISTEGRLRRDRLLSPGDCLVGSDGVHSARCRRDSMPRHRRPHRSRWADRVGRDPLCPR